LRRVKGPIVVFCSHGDNITPPQQALGWVLDLYDSVDEIRTHGQTIVYSVHDSIGHLGIFVSGKVAKKEHDEFTSNMDFIDLLPPGLYEAVLVETQAAGGDVDESVGRYVIRFEARTLDDIRALGGNSDEDERRFATVAKVSDSLNALYKTLWSPWIKALSSAETAKLMQDLHPARLQFSMFADANPFMRPVAQASEWVRAHRKAVDSANPFLQIEGSVSNHIEAALDAFRDARDSAIERWFLAFYGSPLVQASVGIDAAAGPPRPRPGADPAHALLVTEKIADLRRRIGEGGLKEAAIRGMLYVAVPRAAADERSFAVLRKLRQATPEAQQMPLAELKQLVREQFFMLLLDCPGAIAAIPSMLPPDQAARERILELIRETAVARGAMEPEVEQRFAEISRLFAAQTVSGDEAAAEVAARPRDRTRARH
jgi:hypothetical protein